MGNNKTKLKFYIAGRWTKKSVVAEVMRAVENAGHAITLDWTKIPDDPPEDFEGEKTKQAWHAYNAIRDLYAVVMSNVFVLLTDEGGVGMYVELGAAIQNQVEWGGTNVYVIGKHLDRSIFFHHPVVKIRDSIQDVLREVEGLLPGQAVQE